MVLSVLSWPQPASPSEARNTITRMLRMDCLLPDVCIPPLASLEPSRKFQSVLFFTKILGAFQEVFLSRSAFRIARVGFSGDPFIFFERYGHQFGQADRGQKAAGDAAREGVSATRENWQSGP